PYGTKVKIERADELVIDASLGFSRRGEAAQAIEIRSLTPASLRSPSSSKRGGISLASLGFSRRGEAAQAIEIRSLTPASLRSPSSSKRGGISLASLGFSRRGEAAQAIEIRSLTLTSFFIFSLLLKLTLRNAPK